MGKVAELDHNGAKIAYPGYLMHSSQPYYTISAAALLLTGSRGPLPPANCFCLNILLDIQVSRISGLLTMLNKAGQKFLISLPEDFAKDEVTLKALLPYCYLLLSMDLYAASDAPFIPVLCEGEGATLRTEIVHQYFREQGIEALRLPVFNYGRPGIQQDASCSFLSPDVSDPTSKPEVVHTLPAIIACKPTQDAAKLFKEIESRVQIDPEAQLLEERKEFEAEMTRWENRALLYRHFLQLSKQVQEQEYYEIIHWYNHEYEILPLWYKQFGHIVKVIMGKRSFRSLFNDNVKKYKD